MKTLPMMSRPTYIAYRTFEMLVSLGSRAINAGLFGGSTHQTLSARSFIEGRTNPVWAKRRDRIDWLFGWQKTLLGHDMPHCEWAFHRSIDEALRTLEQARTGGVPYE